MAGKQYKQMLIYVPAVVYQDSQWPFAAGSPCEIELNVESKELVVRPIGEKEAKEKGWTKRQRSKK